MIKWHKSEEGSCISKCCRFEITPNYWGRVNPLDYHLSFDGHGLGDFNTQKDAKKAANDYCAKMGIIEITGEVITK